MFKGVIPRRMGMRRIAGIRSSNLCLPNIGNLYELNLILGIATLMPKSETSFEGDWMFRNHKGLVNFWKGEVFLKN
jgi:hypothetical protein